MTGRRAARGASATLAATLAATFAAMAVAQGPSEVTLPRVEVLAPAPLPGLGIPLLEFPGNAQTFGRRDLDRQREDDVARFLWRNATGAALENAQGNPFQQDLLFRGFLSSPVLGSPQGISVFQDGVRVNEPFGDVVNWDFVPMIAIAGMQILPGSNPVFGLNSLGGAITLQTKRGDRYPGTAIELTVGSFGRRQLSVEAGGSSGALDAYFAANLTSDDGWADHNPSRVRQFFGQLGWRGESTDLAVSFTGADNRLEGSQTIPVDWLDRPKGAYTWPDENRNALAFVNATLVHRFDVRTAFSASLYGRRATMRNTSSNVNDDFEDGDDPQAFIDRSAVGQHGFGGAIQLALERHVAGMLHRVALGASLDAGRVDFTQDAQPATFTPERGAEPLGEFEPETDARTRHRYVGVYLTDTIELATAWALTVAGRYNHARVAIADRSGTDPALDGTHRFARFNPALGVTWNPSPALSAWAGYNEGMRAPTAIELTCADPDAPCKLPNNFLADPPLSKVVSRSLEAGARGRVGAASSWSAAVFATELDDDIHFVASTGAAINAGYFRNVGTTRRVGLELAGSTAFGAMSLAARYGYVQATYRTAFTSSSPANTSADADGRIQVLPGDRIPGVPTSVAKLIAEYAIGERSSVSLSVVGVSSRYARGDENNQDARGRIPGYAVAAFDMSVGLAPRLTLLGHVANLFNRRYATVGVLGGNFFTGPDRTFGPSQGYAPVAAQFRGPAAPIGGWIGLRYAFP
ncbi:MAG: TonB-dependent receptor [Betaproteobacteria bacterium]